MSELKILSKEVREKKASKVRIMQFGEGNFLRAFIDWMIQKMNDSGLYDGHVVVVQPLPFGRVKELEKQDGLYTLILQGINEKKEPVRQASVIDVLDDFINPYEEYQKYLSYGESKDLEVVISNTTEAGICFDEKDVSVDLEHDTPSSYPGKLLALLKRRYDKLGEGYGLAIIPCELIDDNGDKLKAVLNQLMERRGMEEGFIRYVNESCHFTSTLVDRIVPGFPKDEFASFCEQFGYIDNNMVKGEYFHLYVLKEEPFVEKKFPVDKVGLHAIYVPDVHPYKQRKVRILNGTHTTLVPVSYLAGLDEVRESLLVDEVHRFIVSELKNEIVPTVTTKDAQAFADDVLQRFLNPYVHHKLMSIALNSLSKFRERDLPTMLDDVRNGLVPSHMCFAFASLIKFYEGYRIKDGKREEIALQDNPDEIAFFKDVWASYRMNLDASKLVHDVFSRTDVWGRDLNEEKAIYEETLKWLKVILAAPSQMDAIREFLKEHE